eukprot:gene15665-21189_t
MEKQDVKIQMKNNETSTNIDLIKPVEYPENNSDISQIKLNYSAPQPPSVEYFSTIQTFSTNSNIKKDTFSNDNRSIAWKLISNVNSDMMSSMIVSKTKEGKLKVNNSNNSNNEKPDTINTPANDRAGRKRSNIFSQKKVVDLITSDNDTNIIYNDSNERKSGKMNNINIFSMNSIIQLRGIFLSLDDDQDGLLTTSQLADALRFIGFIPRDQLLSKFCVNLTEMKMKGKNLMKFSTSFDTFIQVLSNEVNRLHGIAEELNALFLFLDDEKSGYLSKTDLQHVLIEVLTPLSLTTAEFNSFNRAIPYDKFDRVKVEEIKQLLLLGIEV